MKITKLGLMGHIVVEDNEESFNDLIASGHTIFVQINSTPVRVATWTEYVALAGTINDELPELEDNGDAVAISAGSVSMSRMITEKAEESGISEEEAAEAIKLTLGERLKKGLEAATKLVHSGAVPKVSVTAVPASKGGNTCDEQRTVPTPPSVLSDPALQR